MDARLAKALEFSNFLETQNNQKRIFLAHWIILGLTPVSFSPITLSYHHEIEISSLIELLQ